MKVENIRQKIIIGGASDKENQNQQIKIQPTMKPKCCGTFDCNSRDNTTWECYNTTYCISQK